MAAYHPPFQEKGFRDLSHRHGTLFIMYGVHNPVSPRRFRLKPPVSADKINNPVHDCVRPRLSRVVLNNKMKKGTHNKQILAPVLIYNIIYEG